MHKNNETNVNRKCNLNTIHVYSTTYSTVQIVDLWIRDVYLKKKKRKRKTYGFNTDCTSYAPTKYNYSVCSL